MGQPAPPSTARMEVAARWVGLIASIVFMGFAVVYLSFGRADTASSSAQRVFYALMILFGGPIAYFWVAQGTRIKLKLGSGTLVMGGGYAVAFAIVLLVYQIVPEEKVWREFRFNNAVQGIKAGEIVLTTLSAGDVIVERLDDENRPKTCRLVCGYGPDLPEITVNIKAFRDMDIIPVRDFGDYRLPREGPPSETRELKEQKAEPEGDAALLLGKEGNQ